MVGVQQRARKNAMGFNHVVTLQDLDYPSAQRIQQLQTMLDGSGAHLLSGCRALTALPVECGSRVPWELICRLHSPTGAPPADWRPSGALTAGTR